MESSDIDKYKKDIKRLAEDGMKLFMAIQAECMPEQFRAEVEKQTKDKKKAIKFINDLPSFTDSYQSWYTESLAVIRQILPDRISDFVKLYEKPRAVRKNIKYGNYVIEDAQQDLRVSNNWGEVIVDRSAAIPLVRQQLRIIESVEKRFESSLFDIRQLVQADLFDSELEAAAELNKKGFTRGAGAIAGVVLEGHLQQVCDNHKVKVIKKDPGINDLAQLLKSEEVIDTPTWRKVQHLADLRNLCDHKKKKDPTKEDMEELIGGVEKIVKTMF